MPVDVAINSCSHPQPENDFETGTASQACTLELCLMGHRLFGFPPLRVPYVTAFHVIYLQITFAASGTSQLADKLHQNGCKKDHVKYQFSPP